MTNSDRADRKGKRRARAAVMVVREEGKREGGGGEQCDVGIMGTVTMLGVATVDMIKWVCV